MKPHLSLRPVASLAAALFALAAFLCASPVLADEAAALEKADVDDMLKINFFSPPPDRPIALSTAFTPKANSFYYPDFNH